jgi:hypothetical protein
MRTATGGGATHAAGGAGFSGRDQGTAREQEPGAGVALAVAILVLLLIAPLLWEATDSLIAGEHFGDPGNQWSLVGGASLPDAAGRRDGGRLVAEAV